MILGGLTKGMMKIPRKVLSQYICQTEAVARRILPIKKAHMDINMTQCGFTLDMRNPARILAASPVMGLS